MARPFDVQLNPEIIAGAARALVEDLPDYTSDEEGEFQVRHPFYLLYGPSPAPSDEEDEEELDEDWDEEDWDSGYGSLSEEEDEDGEEEEDVQRFRLEEFQHRWLQRAPPAQAVEQLAPAHVPQQRAESPSPPGPAPASAHFLSFKRSREEEEEEEDPKRPRFGFFEDSPYDPEDPSPSTSGTSSRLGGFRYFHFRDPEDSDDD